MNDLMELGKVLIQWGLGFILTGLVTVLIGFGLILIGKVINEEKTDLILATMTHLLNN